MERLLNDFTGTVRRAVDGFPGHGSYEKLFAECGIDSAAIEKALCEL